MSKKKRTPLDEPDLSDFHLIQLRGMQRDLGFIVSMNIARIPGIMSHAAKAVEQVEWMIDAVEKLRASAPPREEKKGAPR